MKKIFTVSLFAALALSAFAEYKFPGYHCTDQAQFTAAIAEAKTPYSRCLNTILLRMLQKPVSGFAEYCALVDEVVDAEKTATEAGKKNLKTSLKKQVPYIKNLWTTDVWKFCQANPSAFDVRFAMTKAKAIGFSDAQLYAFLTDKLMHGDYAPELVSQAIDKLAAIGPTLSGVDVKADFQKLNRKFSIYLLKNKAKWEPVIAKIRTTLETY